jgi:hypothetical protein
MVVVWMGDIDSAYVRQTDAQIAKYAIQLRRPLCDKTWIGQQSVFSVRPLTFGPDKHRRTGVWHVAIYLIGRA